MVGRIFYGKLDGKLVVLKLENLAKLKRGIKVLQGQRSCNEQNIATRDFFTVSAMSQSLIRLAKSDRYFRFRPLATCSRFSVALVVGGR